MAKKQYDQEEAARFHFRQCQVLGMKRCKAHYDLHRELYGIFNKFSEAFSNTPSNIKEVKEHVKGVTENDALRARSILREMIMDENDEFIDDITLYCYTRINVNILPQDDHNYYVTKLGRLLCHCTWQNKIDAKFKHPKSISDVLIKSLEEELKIAESRRIDVKNILGGFVDFNPFAVMIRRIQLKMAKWSGKVKPHQLDYFITPDNFKEAYQRNLNENKQP